MLVYFVPSIEREWEILSRLKATPFHFGCDIEMDFVLHFLNTNDFISWMMHSSMIIQLIDHNYTIHAHTHTHKFTHRFHADPLFIYDIIIALNSINQNGIWLWTEQNRTDSSAQLSLAQLSSAQYSTYQTVQVKSTDFRIVFYCLTLPSSRNAFHQTIYFCGNEANQQHPSILTAPLHVISLLTHWRIDI